MLAVEFSQEAMFQPGYEEDEQYDTPDHQAVPKTHDFDYFQYKLSRGILDAQSLNLHEIPPSVFDNKPPIKVHSY